MSLWHRHPGVRSGEQLTFGERAADSMRSGMGSWTFMAAATACLVTWMVTDGFGFDPSPYFKLNLFLSCFAALQGAILLISAKRSDQIASEVALHTLKDAEELKAQSAQILTINRQQLDLLQVQQRQGEILRAIAGAVDPGILTSPQQPVTPELREQGDP
jgi:uncharacterized membrane protein